MITDRDLVLRVMAIGRDPVQALVSDAMTPGVVFCYDDEEAETAAGLMAEKQIRRLPILARNNRLVGIVSWATSSSMAWIPRHRAPCCTMSPIPRSPGDNLFRCELPLSFQARHERSLLVTGLDKDSI